MLNELVDYLYGILGRDIEPFSAWTFFTSIFQEMFVKNALEMTVPWK